MFLQNKMSSLYKKHVLNIKKLLSNINHLQQSTHVQKRGKITARRRKMNRYEKIQRGKEYWTNMEKSHVIVTDGGGSLTGSGFASEWWWWLEGRSWSRKRATLVAQRVAMKGGYEMKKKNEEEEEEGKGGRKEVNEKNAGGWFFCLWKKKWSWNDGNEKVDSGVGWGSGKVKCGEGGRFWWEKKKRGGEVGKTTWGRGKVLEWKIEVE